MNVSEQTAAARSRIEDADFAMESAVLAKTQVLQQIGAAMLAQANAKPQLVLQLIEQIVRPLLSTPELVTMGCLHRYRHGRTL